MTGPIAEPVKSEIDGALAALDAMRLQQERNTFNFQNSGNAQGYKIPTNQVGVNGRDTSPDGEREKEEKRESTQRLVAQQEAIIQQLVQEIQDAQIDYITNTYDSNYRDNVEYLREVDPSLFEASDTVAEMRARGEIVNESPATKTAEGQQIIGMANAELAAETARLAAEKKRDDLQQEKGVGTKTSADFNAGAKAETTTPAPTPEPQTPTFKVNAPENKGLIL